jgi:hypothetical protein
MALFKRNTSSDDTYFSAATDETSLGNILVGMEAITREQLKEAIEVQRARVPEIGGILVELGHITQEQLEEALLKQRIMRGKAKPREVTDFERHKRKKASEAFLSSVRQTVDVASDLKRSLNGNGHAHPEPSKP